MPRRCLPAAYLTRRPWTTDDARSALGAWSASGISMAAFAEREGLDVQRLYRWRRQLGDAPATAARFVELRPRRVEQVEVVLRSGRVLRVSETIHPSLLACLVLVLEDSPAC